MAPVATPTRTRADSSDTPAAGPEPLAPARAPDAPSSPAERFDELFVRPVDADAQSVALPRLPDGWRHAALTERVARQPRERRETILAGAFALAAALWAPLGVFAFLTGSILPFLAASVAAVLVAAAPRPVGASQVIGDLTDRAAPAVDGVRAFAGSVPERLAPLAARLRDVGRRGAARLRSLDETISAAARSGLEGLRTDDHSTPSSTR